MEGVIARMTKDDAGARAAFTAARTEQQQDTSSSRKLRPGALRTGFDRRWLGRKEEALREGRRAVELLPVEKDAIFGIAMVKYLAMIAAWAGDKDLAFRAACHRHPSPERTQLWQLETAAVLGSAARRSALRKIVASLAPK